MERRERSMPFPKGISTKWDENSWFRIWTRVAVSNNRYATRASRIDFDRPPSSVMKKCIQLCITLLIQEDLVVGATPHGLCKNQLTSLIVTFWTFGMVVYRVRYIFVHMYVHMHITVDMSRCGYMYVCMYVCMYMCVWFWVDHRYVYMNVRAYRGLDISE